MHKVAIVLNKVVRNINHYEKYPVFAPPIIIVDITNYEGIVKEGYVYDVANGKFSEPSDTEEPPIIDSQPPQPTQEEIQLQTLLNTEFLVIMSEINGQ